MAQLPWTSAPEETRHSWPELAVNFNRLGTYALTPPSIVGSRDWYAMQRYFFDLRDDDGLVVDEEGLELKDLLIVQEEAARSISDLVRDALRKPTSGFSQQMAIEVRDGAGPVMKLRLTFKIERHN
jgi:Domain of unknown function (DUF6894)